MMTETTTSELRKTGIDVIGDVPWGTHFCSFYETKQDLLEILVPYFKEGLESKEFCVWVLSHAVNVEEAKHALGRAVPELERHLAEGNLEIHCHDKWNLHDGRWDPQRVLQSWCEKFNHTRAKGYAGLRASGDGCWVPNDDRMAFREYEKQVSGIIADQRSIILCTYPLATSPGNQVFDAAHIHEVAVARRNGSWEMVEAPALKEAKAEIERLNEELEQKVKERTRELASANEALRQQILERKELEQQARALIDAIPQQIWSGPSDGTLDYCNERWRSYMGIGLKDLQGDGWQTMLHPNDRDRVLKAWHESVLNGKPYEQEERHRGADGKYRWFLARGVPLRDTEGRIVRWYGTNTDIEDRKRTEEAFNAQALRYKTLMETSTDSIYVMDEKGDLQEANAAFLHRRGYTGAEVKGLNVADWDAEWSRERLQQRLRMLVGESAVFETRHRCKDGSLFEVEVCGTSVPIGGEKLLFCVARDITERKNAERALRESEERFRELAENINEVFWVWTAIPGNACLLYVSPAYQTIWGRSCESLYSSPQSWMEALHPQDKERIHEEGARMDFEKITDWTYRIVRPDQSVRWIRDRIFPVRDRSGVVVRFAGIAQDITESKTIAEALESAEEQYRSIFNNAVDGIFRTSPDGKFLVANPAAARIFGFASPEELIEERRDIAQQGYVEPHRREEFKRLLEEQGVVNGFEFEAYRKDGSRVWISENARAVRSPSGEILYFEGFFEDVTDRKRAEEALRESEERFRTIFEQAPLGISEGEIGTERFVSANQRYVDILGYTVDELRRLTFRDYTHPDDLQKDLVEFQKLAAGEIRTYAMEKRYIRKDGAIIWVNLTVTGLADPGEKPLHCIAVIEEITDRVQAEERLRESEQQMRLFMEATTDCLWRTDLITGRTVRSVGFNRVFGYAMEELDSSLRWWEERLHPDDREKVVSTFQDTIASGGNACSYEYRFRRKDGTLAVIHDRAYIVRDAKGKPLSALGAMTDITERTQAEEARERGLSLMLATLESTADGILVVNTEGKIETFNRLFARMWRLSEEVLASKKDARALRCVLDQLTEPEKFLEKVHYLYLHPEEESFDRLVFKDGRVFERYSRPQLIGGKVAGRVWSFRDATERKRAAKELEDANYQLRILSRQLFHVQEEERRHLARELHDEIGQTLTAAKINLKIIAPDVPAKVTGRLDDSVQLLDRLLRQVRELSLDLRPPLLDELGLVPTLRWLVDQQAQRAGLRVTFTENVDGLEIHPDTQTACFRVAQEAITNIVRHAGAKNVAVELGREAERLTLRVRDDGAGFDPAVTRQRTTRDFTLGLVSMKERALLMRGGFEVQTSPGQGTEIRAWFPLASGEHLSTGTA